MEGSDLLRLEDFVVGPLPTLIYVPNFVSANEENQLLRHIYEAPVSKWKSLKNRRLQNWGGAVHDKGLLPQDLPPWISKITQRICEKTGLFPSPINHVLINEYLPDQGIMKHQDGPAYFPVAAIISLGSPAVIDFTPHPRFAETAINGSPPTDFYSLLLMPRSLLIFKDDAYTNYLHGIEDSEEHNLSKVLNREEMAEFGEEERKMIRRSGTRVSLTCRLVPKIGCSLIGSLGAQYNGVLLSNLALALFALVAIENNSQSLGRTYAALLASGILLDIIWLVLFSHEIWNMLSREKYSGSFLLSVRITLCMQVIASFVRLCSSFLWIQMYRLGASYVDGSAYREADFDSKYSFLNPPSQEPCRQHSISDDILGGSIYDPAYYSSLFEDSQDRKFAKEDDRQIILDKSGSSASESEWSPSRRLQVRKSDVSSEIHAQSSKS